MKGSKEALAKYLTVKFENNMRNKKKLRSYIDYMVENGFPVAEVTDVIQLRKEVIDCSDRMLYYLFKAVKDQQQKDEKEDRDSHKIEDYFSAREIKEYETTKFKPLKFSFPIKWNMIEVSEGNQWIGKITVKELMRLRDAQLINYNERTQRTLKRVVKNEDFEYYQIYLNRGAVDAIMDSYNKGQYIPNTITLNLPEDADFRYSDGMLTIKNAERLDIIDGYHRYIAMSNIYNEDSKFDYPMELRVVCFSEDHAKQFIWQEDQKTKMRKLDSESLNQNSSANQVINMINQDPFFVNIIGRNKAIIDQGLAANLIEKIWFNTDKKIDRKKIIEVREIITACFHGMFSSDNKIFDKPWSYEFTVVALCLMGDKNNTGLPILDVIKETTETICSKPEWKVMLGKKGIPISVAIVTRVSKFFHEHFD